VLAGTEPVAGVQPPFAMVNVRGRENAPEAPANVGILWDISGCSLEPGINKIHWKVAVQDFISDAGNFVFLFAGGDGKNAKIQTKRRPRINFSDGKVFSIRPGAQIPFSAGEVLELEIVVDTKQKIWSSSVNGDPLATDLPFSDELLEELDDEIRPGGFSYAIAGGTDHSRPGSAFALTDVILTKVP
jgi:hypothetical protein